MMSRPMNLRGAWLAAGLLLVLLLAVAAVLPGTHLPRVAHAGGGIDGETYTNSFQALEFNRDKYRLFEIDFEWTSDGQLVCIHDWDKSAQKLLGRSFASAPTVSEFQEATRGKRFTPCTALTLIEWLGRNDGAVLVTDAKSDNVAVARYFAEHFPQFRDRVVPQIYDPAEYAPVKALGYQRIIWTLYRFTGSNEDVVRIARSQDLFAVTMPVARVESGLAQSLGEVGISVYVHTINDEAERKRLSAKGADEIYTDWLPAR